MAASGYRRLLKASRHAFRGHEVALVGARNELRTHFYKNSRVTDKEELGDIYYDVMDYLYR